VQHLLDASQVQQLNECLDTLLAFLYLLQLAFVPWALHLYFEPICRVGASLFDEISYQYHNDPISDEPVVLAGLRSCHVRPHPAQSI